MKYHHVFRHMTASPNLQAAIEKKLDRCVAAFAKEPCEARVVFSHRDDRHEIHCHLFGAHDLSVDVRVEGGDPYALVDQLDEKIRRQLRKRKTKRFKHHSEEFEHHNMGAIRKSEKGGIPDSSGL